MKSCASKLARIAAHDDRLVRQVERKLYFRMRDALKQDCLLDDWLQVFRLHDRRRHARERREFIDHLPDIVDLTNNGVRAGGKNLGLG